MVALANIAVLVVSSVVFTVFYVMSARPAALEKEIGPSAYARCARYRLISSVFMFVASASFILYRWFPLPLPIAERFPWPWWVSAAIAVVIAIPSALLMLRGIRDAGEETMTPTPEHTLYGGIYERIRHPQAAGEVMIWWVIAFLLNSPFLVLISFAYLPVWVYFCLAEERDLVLRYGKEYEDYRASTGFWWPRLRSRRGTDP